MNDWAACRLTRDPGRRRLARHWILPGLRQDAWTRAPDRRFRALSLAAYRAGREACDHPALEHQYQEGDWYDHHG